MTTTADGTGNAATTPALTAATPTTSEREDADRTGSSQKVVRLHTKARKLFTDLVQSGEGGELLLFALAEKLLRLPQLICKMSLNTNTRMHIHGADGLHAGVDEKTGKLLLYWGESKIFGDVTSAVRDCLKSLAPILLDHGASKRDLQRPRREGRAPRGRGRLAALGRRSRSGSVAGERVDVVDAVQQGCPVETSGVPVGPTGHDGWRRRWH